MQGEGELLVEDGLLLLPAFLSDPAVTKLLEFESSVSDSLHPRTLHPTP